MSASKDANSAEDDSGRILLEVLRQGWVGSHNRCRRPLVVARTKGSSFFEAPLTGHIAKRTMSGAFVLESGAGVLARAEKPSALHRSVVIEHSGRRYTLRAKSALRHELLLFDDFKQIGSLSPEGILARGATVDLPREWVLPVRIFVMWLASMLWNDH